ncbi:MAG: hypothetical protein H0V66_10775 [Bdellovibrionales bacterium]|nr:hypothetical protein [Bdellovibrionales bacterium]
MEQLKVKKKDVLVLNLIIFLGLSFVFLYLQYAYRHHLSPFSMAYLKKSVELFWYASVPLIFCAILVWRHHRWSLPVYSFCALLISYKVIEGLFIEFNKIIVIALFCYTVISYFLYQLFSYYLSLASLNANYSPSDLFDPLLREMPCSIVVEELEIPGHLTNWDDEGCFIKTNHPSMLGQKVKVIIQFKGRKFEQEGELVAHSVDFKGIGIKFGKTPKGLNVFNWAEFNELIQELGFKPERLR